MMRFFYLLIFLNVSPFLVGVSKEGAEDISSSSIQDRGMSSRMGPIITLAFSSKPGTSSAPVLLSKLGRHGIQTAFFLVNRGMRGSRGRGVIGEVCRRNRLVKGRACARYGLSGLRAKRTGGRLRRASAIVRGVAKGRPIFTETPCKRLPISDRRSLDEVCVK